MDPGERTKDAGHHDEDRDAVSTTAARDDNGLKRAAAGTQDGRSGAAGGPGMGARRATKAKRRKESGDAPPLPRVQLDSLQRVRREMASLYAEAKHGRRDVGDSSKLVNMLALIARIIEGGELERRLVEVEKLAAGRGPP